MAALLLASCAKEDWNWLVGTPINVVATPAATRSASDIQTASFEEGTKIHAYYSDSEGNSIGNTPTVLTASAPDANGKNVLTPDVQPYYPQSGTVDIYALYPTDQSVLTRASESFTVQADQSSDASYKLSDLMWAGTTGQARTESDVELTFSHLMAKMIVSVTGKEGVTITSVKLTNAVRTIPLQNLTTSSRSLGTVSATSDEALKTITIGSDADGATSISGAALFPPQTITANFIEVATNYGTAKYSVNKTFESGKQYTVNLTVTRQQVGCTTTITDWESDGGSIAVPPGSSAGLKIAAIDDQPYSGLAITPTLTITYTPNDEEGNESYTYTLTSDDYDAEFFNNTNVGTATIIITGKSNENNSDSQLRTSISKIKAITSFNITTATGNIAYTKETLVKDYEYYGTISTDDIDLNKNGGDGNFTYTSSKENVATVAETGVVTIKGVGTTTITAIMDDQGNYTADTTSYTLTINPRKISTAVTKKEIVITPSVTSVPYTGQAYQPAVTITDNGRLLQKGVHYTATYDNNTNHGTATITIKGVEGGVYDATDTYKATTTFTITTVATGLTIDDTAVTLPVDFSITRTASTKFGTITYSSDDEDVAKVDETTGVVTAKGTGTTYINATVTKDANENYPTTTVRYSVTVVESYWSYGYTGTVQSWTCPLTGVYKLEAFGAQGGTCGGFNGGRGAYIAGQLKVEKDQVLYIYVGQAGKTVTAYGAPYSADDGTQGGWNGGGYFTTTSYTSTTDTRSQHNFCGGGGATDFALSGGAAWNTTAHMNTRILVAGGGGGALYREYDANNYKFTGGGGGGGAPVGEDGYGGSKPGGGATLTAGGTAGSSDATAGTFGYGGNYSGSNENYNGTTTNAYSIYLSAGMGGGGWYGGGSGGSDTANENPDRKDSNNKAAPLFSRQGSGGGGSSYIWSSVDKYNGATYASKWPSGITAPDTKFQMTLVGFIEGSRSGNGEARITYMGEEE